MPFCTSCGADLAPGSNFCTGCGAQFQSSSAQPQPQAQPTIQQPQAPSAPVSVPVPVQQQPVAQQASDTGLDMQKVALVGAVVLIVGVVLVLFMSLRNTQSEALDGPMLDTSSLQVIKAYPCEDTQPDCQVQGNLCLEVRNIGERDIPLSELGSALVVYELPDAPELGDRPVINNGASFTIDDEEVCCQFSYMSNNGVCGANKKSIASREKFTISFFGEFEDANGESKKWIYSIAKSQHIIVRLDYFSSDLKLEHMVV